MTEVGVLVEERREIEIWYLRCSRPSARWGGLTYAY
jgi:hypothetical protein